MSALQKIILLLTLSFMLPVWSQQRGLPGALIDVEKSTENQSRSVSTKEVSIARENFAVTAKNYCVNFWSAADKLNLLANFATVSEQCKCTEDEMGYLATDDLAVRLLQMQMQASDVSVIYLREDEIKATIDEWQSKYQVANKACTGRFIRRRESSR